MCASSVLNRKHWPGDGLSLARACLAGKVGGARARFSAGRRSEGELWLWHSRREGGVALSFLSTKLAPPSSLFSAPPVNTLNAGRAREWRTGPQPLGVHL